MDPGLVRRTLPLHPLFSPLTLGIDVLETETPQHIDSKN
jgi:hypothetical protein